MKDFLLYSKLGYVLLILVPQAVIYALALRWGRRISRLKKERNQP